MIRLVRDMLRFDEYFRLNINMIILKFKDFLLIKDYK